MTMFVDEPVVIDAAGHPPKRIEEFIGRARTGAETVSIARMVSPPGWSEPGQTPEFDEFTIVLSGAVVVETRMGTHTVRKGQAIRLDRDNWVRYSTPSGDGAEYISVCVPAFSPETVHRDED